MKDILFLHFYDLIKDKQPKTSLKAFVTMCTEQVYESLYKTKDLFDLGDFLICYLAQSK